MLNAPDRFDKATLHHNQSHHFIVQRRQYVITMQQGPQSSQRLCEVARQ